jgi:hypothetical protein
MEFYDIAAVVAFLRKVIWTVPGFTVDAYRDRLAELYDSIERHGPSWPTHSACSSRPAGSARKPTRPASSVGRRPTRSSPRADGGSPGSTCQGRSNDHHSDKPQ